MNSDVQKLVSSNGASSVQQELVSSNAETYDMGASSSSSGIPDSDVLELVSSNAEAYDMGASSSSSGIHDIPNSNNTITISPL